MANRGPYIGAFIDDCHSQEIVGYPKAREVLKGWSDEQLRRERHEMLKGSFGIFGRSAARVLRLIDDEIEART